jgi:hypothetical protein
MDDYPHITTVKELASLLRAEAGKGDLPVLFHTGDGEAALVVLSVYKVTEHDMTPLVKGPYIAIDIGELDDDE